MHFDIFLQYFNGLGIVTILIVFLRLLYRPILIVSHSTNPSFVQTALNTRIIMLRKRRSRLPVEQISWRILFQQLTRSDLIDRLVQRLHLAMRLSFLFGSIRHTNIGTFTADSLDWLSLLFLVVTMLRQSLLFRVDCTRRPSVIWFAGLRGRNVGIVKSMHRSVVGIS